MQNIVVFFNGTRGIKVIQKLISFGHGILTTVIPPNKDFDVIQKEIEKIGLKCLRPKNVNDKDVILKLKKLYPKLFIVAGYSTIFKSELINLPEKGTINLHAGSLPKYRGGSPLNWQIINGETKATISLIKLDQEIDSGEVLQEQDILIDVSTDINDLHTKANELFPELTKKVIDQIDNTGNLSGRSQDFNNAVYWHQRKDDDGHIDFKTLDVTQVNQLVRALTIPYPGAWAFLEQKKVRIFKTEISQFDLRGVPGRICYIQSKGPYIICKDKALLIKKYMIDNNSELKLKNGQYLT